jgi:phage N-6-adenine-methyltransferase
MNNDLMFSSKSAEWETPQDLFDILNLEFDFDIDLAASATNAKVQRFYTKEDDALTKDWHAVAKRGWLNPPYTRGLCAKFIAKAADERAKGFLTVMLLPSRTDTKAFHSHIYDYKDKRAFVHLTDVAKTLSGTRQGHARPGVEIRFLPGRLKFVGAPDAAPFPSMLVIFRP